MKRTTNIQKEIKILEEYTETVATDIVNMLGMLDEQLSFTYEMVEKLPENEKKDLLKPLWYMDTLLRSIKSKVNENLFWAIGSVVFNLQEEAKA